MIIIIVVIYLFIFWGGGAFLYFGNGCVVLQVLEVYFCFLLELRCDFKLFLNILNEEQFVLIVFAGLGNFFQQFHLHL